MTTHTQRRYARSSAGLPPVSLSRVPSSDDTDIATRQTVERMAELIRTSAADPVVKRCAEFARARFGCGSNDPAEIAWAVFWYVKHCVKFRTDEATMLQVGERNQQDLLIAPAVLVRMKDPSEDCDGFTMLTAALLTALGVPVLIATVATDLDDPRRWSHVFLVAMINGRPLPLDTSHGSAPGWMVPKNRINRFQTWALDGTPADVSLPNFQGLHGFGAAPQRVAYLRPPVLLVRGGRGRGFGQTDTTSTDWLPNDFSSLENTITTDFNSLFNSGSNISIPVAGDTTAGGPAFSKLTSLGLSQDQAVAVLNTPGVISVAPPNASLTPAQGQAIASIVNSSGQTLAKVLTIAGGGSSVTLPNGTQLLYSAGQTAPSSSNILGSLSSSTGLSSTTLIIAGVALVAVLLLKK